MYHVTTINMPSIMDRKNGKTCPENMKIVTLPQLKDLAIELKNI